MNFNKNKINLQGKMRGLLMALFFVGGFLFFQTNVSLAATYNVAVGGSCVNHTDCDSEFCNNGICAIGGSNCVCRRITNAGGYVTLRPKSNQNTKEACDKYCIGIQGNSYCYNNLIPAFCDSLNVSDTLTSNNPSGVAGPAATVEDLKNRGVQGVLDPVAAALEAVMKGFLFGLLQFLSMIFGMTGTLFEWLLNPVNISGPTGLLNKSAVKEVWIMVRDTLNMTFILILLFAAFCTVFQVEKWNLKKVWISILINALLVNFSFPIARFFIDVSNVAMYYFLNNMFTGSGQGSGSSIMASFGETSKLSSLLTPDNYQGAEIPYLLAAIIFTFILGMTLFVLAALFVVRLIALVLIVMFSPIGFVGNIFPAMNKFASDWWSNLFKYAFFGPVMVFMIMVSLRIMQAMPNDTWFAAAQSNSTADQANWIANAAYYTIPIIILWMAMGIAQKMGVAGADKIVGAAKKWGGSIARSPWTGIKAVSKATGVTGGVKKGWENARKSGRLFGKDVKFLKDGHEDSETRIAGYMGNRGAGVEAANRNIHAKHVAEKEKEMEDMRTNSSELKTMLDPTNYGKHDKAEIEAAAKVLSKREAFKDANELQAGLEAMDYVYDTTTEVGRDQSQERKTEFLKKADKNIFTNAGQLTAALGHLGNDFKTVNQIIDKMEGQAFDGMLTADYEKLSKNGEVKKVLDKRLKKEGKTNVLVNIELAKGRKRREVVKEILDSLKTEDIAKQEMFRKVFTVEAKAYVEKFKVRGSKDENLDKYQKINAG